MPSFKPDTGLEIEGEANVVMICWHVENGLSEHGWNKLCERTRQDVLSRPIVEDREAQEPSIYSGADFIDE
jgi:hypothetical protein